MQKKTWAQACLKVLSSKCVYKTYIYYMYKKDLALNNLHWLICHKTKPNYVNMYKLFVFKNSYLAITMSVQ